MSYAYPLMLDVTARPIVIVGGGKVAARKCTGLLAAGATSIRVVSPEFCDGVPSAVVRVAERFEARHLDGAGLVFAATNIPAVNDAVVRDAHARGLLVNRADGSDTEPGDFATPALHREGAVTLTVSAGGSPVLATKIRDCIVRHLDRDLLMMADAMTQLRDTVLNDPNASEAQRRAVFLQLASDEAIAALRDGGLEGLTSWVRSALRNPPSEIHHA